MIVVDSSVIIAIAQQEAEAARFAECIEIDGDPRISAASVLECSIVMRALRQLGTTEIDPYLDALLANAGFRIEPITLVQLAIARQAHARFGKGTGHPAQLNFGDCFSYALAKTLDAPLLYKGGDFAKTDIASAL